MAAEELQLRLLSDLSSLEALAEEWGALMDRCEGNEPMLGPIWLVNWWRVYGPLNGRELCLMSFRRAGRLVGIAPFCRRRVSVGGVSLQRLELMGSGEDEADETCSEYIGILAERGEEQSVAHSFGEALRAGEFGPWDELVMTNMSSEIVMSPLIARALGETTIYEVQGGAPFARLPGSWDDYLAALPSSRRYLIRRSLKDWEKWAKEPPVLKRVTNEDELEDAIDMLAKLHQLRWTEADHVGAFASEHFSSFHRQTMRALFRVGALWLCWLEVEGEPVCAIYNIVWNNQVRFYQSGRKVNLPKKVRAGLVIHACAIRESIEAGYTHYDFLAGTTRYKMQLSNNVRPLMQLTLRRPSTRAKLRHMGEAGIDLGRTLRNEWRNRFGRSGSES